MVVQMDTVTERILIAGDDKASLVLLKQILEQKYEIDIVCSEKELTEKLSSYVSYDLIMCAPKMLQGGPRSLVNNIRNLNSLADKPIIFYCDDVDRRLEEECFHSGADDVIYLESSFFAISTRVSHSLELYAYRRSIRNVKLEQSRRIDHIRQQIIQAFATIIEGRDSSTGMHIKRTAAYVDIVVKGLRERNFYVSELSDEKWSAIVSAAPLHDLGKIAVTDSILCKPGKLTKEEFDIIKTHAKVGGEMIRETLSDIENGLVFSTAVEMAMYHHEKWNGTGYPFGLKEYEIPLSARIMAIADVFDALVSKRCYKEAFSYDEAFDILRKESGTHFDPKIFEVFEQLRDEIVAVSESWAL